MLCPKTVKPQSKDVRPWHSAVGSSDVPVERSRRRDDSRLIGVTHRSLPLICSFFYWTRGFCALVTNAIALISSTFQPKMHQMSFDGRAPPGPAGELWLGRRGNKRTERKGITRRGGKGRKGKLCTHISFEKSAVCRWSSMLSDVKHYNLTWLGHCVCQYQQCHLPVVVLAALACMCKWCSYLGPAVTDPTNNFAFQTEADWDHPRTGHIEALVCS